MKNKKGQLNLQLIGGVMLAFLVIAVIGIVILLTGNELTGVADTLDTQTDVLVNITTESAVNESTGVYVTGYSDANRNCVLTITSAENGTGEVATGTIPTNNYSVSACQITAAADSDYNISAWNISGTITYSNDNAYNMEQNLSTATAEIFGDTGTIFSILTVVVIMGAIALIIFIVVRFSGASGLGNTSGIGGKKEFGSDTVGGM